MNGYVKSYLTFFAFLAITKIVVGPALKSVNIPIVSSVVS